MASSSAIDGAIQGNMRGQGVVRAGEGITLFTSNKDMDEVVCKLRVLGHFVLKN